MLINDQLRAILGPERVDNGFPTEIYQVGHTTLGPAGTPYPRPTRTTTLLKASLASIYGQRRQTAPSVGDWVRVYRNGYWHHGIYIGNGWVIHFTAPGHKDVQNARVVLTDWATFMATSRRAQIVRPRVPVFAPDVIVQRAHLQMGRGGYNLAFNNCEHFASWCVTGRFESVQVKTAGGATVAGVFILILLAL